MYEASGFRYNVLGDMNKCNELSNASFVLLNLFPIDYGICGPEVCTADIYQAIFADPSVIVNGLVGEKFKGISEKFTAISKEVLRY
mmetsp:Transcript_21070/g.3412  ORF Transcript_21070/g.3412 Transcript_21070/m.3412 type:complete len:86 (+) Transcript_21070:156-413(+)